MTGTEHKPLTNKVAQCIHIPDGSVVISGELFDRFSEWAQLEKGYQEHIERFQKQLTDEDAAHTKTIEERDRVEAYADQLADMIGVLCEVEIGEHSSGNFPWENAIEAMRDAIGSKQTESEPLPVAEPQAPIAKITVGNGTDTYPWPPPVSVSLYAPGLPLGEHDVYCVPMSVAPPLREEGAELDDPERCAVQNEPRCQSYPDCHCGWNKITASKSGAGE